MHQDAENGANILRIGPVQPVTPGATRLQPVEQMDMFDYLEAIEKQYAEASLSATAPGEGGKAAFVTFAALFSRFKSAMRWLLANMSIMFGLEPWVNVYTVTRAYGGTEAGGWYYRKYTCVESRQVWFGEAEALRLKLLRRFSSLAWGILSSETQGREVVVLIERRQAAQVSAFRPSYDPALALGPLPKDYVQPAAPALGKDSNRTAESHPPLPKSGVPVERGMTVSAFFDRPKTVINKVLGMTGLKGLCDRCGGSGRTPFTHVHNGICFKCEGAGRIE